MNTPSRPATGRDCCASNLSHIDDIADAMEEGAIEPTSLLGLSREFVSQHEKLRTGGHGNAFAEAAERVRATYGVTPKQAEETSEMLFRERVSVLEYTRRMVSANQGTPRYAMGIIFAGVKQNLANRQRGELSQLQSGTHPVCHLALPGDDTEITIRTGKAREAVTVASNHLFLYKRRRDNWLALLQAMRDQVPYDELHRRKMYLFTDASRPTPFSDTLIRHVNGTPLIRGKKVLEIGAGNAIDPEHYIQVGGAESVTVVDGSGFIQNRLRERKESSSTEVRKRLIIPDPADMFEMLELYDATGEQFDTTVSHSSVHYFDDTTVSRLFELISKVTKEHWAFSVKAPGAMLDGNGIPLVREVETHRYKDDEEYVHKRAWLNHDGQTRWFRDHTQWEKLLKPYFHVRESKQSQIPDYEVPGQGHQLFYVFICEPKSEAEKREGKSGSDSHKALQRSSLPIALMTSSSTHG